MQNSWKLSNLLIFTLSVLIHGSSFASYTCGPNLETYQVYDGQFTLKNGTGVRCVKFVNPNDNKQFIWYGEGHWGNFQYRHLGDAIHVDAGTARATDIFGNGENGTGFTYNLHITPSAGGGMTPAIIRISGAWNEVWLRMNNHIASNYTSNLSEVSNCGSNMIGYSAYLGDGTSFENGQYIGTRCKLNAVNTWYGEGLHGNSPYIHIGTFIGDATNPTTIRYGAFDICPDESHICNSFHFGSLTLRSLNVFGLQGWIVPQWGEEWHQR